MFDKIKYFVDINGRNPLKTRKSFRQENFRKVKEASRESRNPLKTRKSFRQEDIFFIGCKVDGRNPLKTRKSFRQNLAFDVVDSYVPSRNPLKTRKSFRLLSIRQRKQESEGS